MITIKTKMKWKLCALNFFVFFAISMVNTQMIPYLSKLGYDVMQRGVILASSAIVSIVGQFLFGFLCDRYKKIKRFFLLAYILLMIASFCMLCWQEQQFYYHLLSVSLMGGMVKVLMGLDETWMLEISSEQYGMFRAWGALGLAVGSIITGMIVQGGGYSFLLTAFGGISILTLFFIWSSKDAKKTGKGMQLQDITGFFKNRRYLLLVSIYLLVYMIGTADQYVVIDKMLLIDATTKQIGIKWALQSFMEVPLFLFASKILARIKPFTLLWFGTLMYGVKFFAYAFFDTPWMIIATAGLQLVTLPIIMLTSKLLIKEVTPSHVCSSAQMFAMAVFIGFSGLITPLITSFLCEHIGYDATLYGVAGFAIVPLGLIVLYHRIDQKETPNTNHLAK